MPLDIWFPLAIYYADLEESAAWNGTLAAQIDALHAAAGARRTAETTSWTGDVHNVDRLHLDPAFDWLTQQVGTHALRYLAELGHDLAKTDLYIQRAWPVLAARGQRVSRHAHHTAHLSAVYYVAAPDDDAGGKTRFFNDAAPNELAAGIGSSMTGGYAAHNQFNYGSAEYTPIPGRLLLFPAKQSHAVDANDTDSARISISYDLVITSRGGSEDGRHEFLMPPPFLWRRVGEEGVAVPAPVGPPRRDFATTATRARAIDAFTLPEAAGHPLWETHRFAHVSPPAAWDGYEAALSDAAWAVDPTTGAACWFGAGAWRAARDAVDRLHAWLLGADLPTHGATLTAPVLRCAGMEAAYRRGTAHLCCYLRLDPGAAGDARIAFGEGGAERLPPGELVVVSGFRRQRIEGPGTILCFELDLPGVARVAALRLPTLRLDGVEDMVAFAAATAQPLAHPLPPPAELFAKFRWRSDRAARRARHASCPAGRRFLAEHADPASATPEELATIRSHGSGKGGGTLLELPDLLTPEECALLRRHADAHIVSVVPDSVDDLPEYQVDLDIAGLEALLGVERTATLLALPERIGAPPGVAPARVDIFLRRYAAEMRSDLAFHSDVSDSTLNIALSGDDAVTGGRLLALDGDRLRVLPRAAGTATLHAGDLVHGVSRIEAGARHSLIVFFHAPEAANIAACG